MLSERAKIVLQFISQEKDESMLKQMENTPLFENLDQYKAFLEILLVLIEKSKFGNSGVKVFLDKIIRDDTYSLRFGVIPRKNAIIEVLKERAILPYVNTSSMLGRMLIEMYANPLGIDSIRFASIFSTNDLLLINENYLDRYFQENSLINGEAMSLLYYCVEDNTKEKVILSKNACRIFREKIITDEVSRFYYLSHFFRPLYQTNSEFLPEATLHVAEPFFLQIFENILSFYRFLEWPPAGQKEAVLKREIEVVMESLPDPEKPFDITDFRITSSLHESVRKMT